VNAALVIVTDVMMKPLLQLPPFLSLFLISLITAALVVWVIARTSDQVRVRQTKRLIQAALFEIRLFNDDPRAVVRSMRDALRHNATYLRLSLVPLALMSVPLLLAMAHLDPYYRYAGLTGGSPALITVTWREKDDRHREASIDRSIALDVPATVKVEAGPVQLADKTEVLWRIRPVAPGDAAGDVVPTDLTVTVRVGDDAITKTVHVSDAPGRRSRARVAPGIAGQLLHPSEPPLEASGPVRAVTVAYPEVAVHVLGMDIDWLVVYGALTMACALALARVFRISA
jgi:hypothetical protein